MVKNRRKSTKLGKQFPRVKNIKDQTRTTLMRAQGTSERGYKVGLFMYEEETIKILKIGETPPNLAICWLVSRTSRTTKHKGTKSLVTSQIFDIFMVSFSYMKSSALFPLLLVPWAFMMVVHG